jgi:hypothetical protein
MRLDHVSYVASHDQISDVVQRIGSQISTAFVDGGIHPQFGTRNFTAPLLNGQYIEVVCALDHPSVEQSAFGRAVKRKANEGGGWLTWVLSTENIAPIETFIGRPSLLGHRKRPDGSELHWKQIGVQDILKESPSPFYIQWEDGEHPSKDGKPHAAISKIFLQGVEPDQDFLKSELSISYRKSISEIVVWNSGQSLENDFEIEFEVDGKSILIN